MRLMRWLAAMVGGVVTVSATVVVVEVPSVARAASVAMALEQKINFDGADRVSPFDVPSGRTATLVLSYSCPSLTTDTCDGGRIVAPVPDGLILGGVNYPPAAMASVASGPGNSRTFNFNTLSPGATGQITIEVTVPDWVTPDSSSYTFASAVSTDNGTTNLSTSNSLTLIGRAASTTRATAALTAGGGLGSTTTYGVSGCIDAVAPGTTWGHLQVEAGATMIVTMPVGATYVTSSAGGVYNSAMSTVTWTAASSQSNNFCNGRQVTVEYPSSHVSNIVGATKMLGIVWSGVLLGSPSGTLGTASVSHMLLAPNPGGGITKSAGTPRPGAASPTDRVSYSIGYSNAGTADWTSLQLSDDIPAAYRTDSISLSNAGSGSATLRMATLRGLDGVAGNSDDGQLFTVTTVAAGGSATINPYTSLPCVCSALAAADEITKVEYTLAGIAAGASTGTMGYSGTVSETDRNAVRVSRNDVVRNEVVGAIVTAAGNLSRGAAASFTIDIPVPTMDPRMSASPSSLAPGARLSSISLSAFPANAPLDDPAYMMLLPRAVQLLSWSATPGTSGLPTPTLTSVSNWGGVTGQTLLRWTFPNGSVQNRNASYVINTDLDFGPGSRGTMRVPGLVTSRSVPYLCGSNYFGSGADTADLDADADLTEVPCKWGADVTLATNASAQLVSSVRGYWDMAFADGPAIGYSRPGADDVLRVGITNIGTVDLTNAVIVDVLPRPGDTATASAAPRNPSTNTFPVVLRAVPTGPVGLTQPMTIYYSVMNRPCRPEVGYSPSGCAAPNWTSTPPVVLADVTAVKFDFGANVLSPGSSWSVDLPSTTPTAGAAEPDFAVVNPITDPGTNERAANSAAFVVTRVDLNSLLSASESTMVGFQMPSAVGLPGRLPVPEALVSTGVGRQVQSVGPTLPVQATMLLISGPNRLSVLDVPGVGIYRVEPGGTLSFTPAASFLGSPTPVAFEVTDVHGQTAQSTFAPSVTAPPAPVATARSSNGAPSAVQTAAINPANGVTLRLRASGAPVSSVMIPGVGTYALGSASSVMFEPVTTFIGAAPPVEFELVDEYGQSSRSTYSPTVDGPPPPTATPLSSPGTRGTQSTNVVVPSSGRIALIDPATGAEAAMVEIPGVGTYRADSLTGVISFTAAADFAGSPPPVFYVIVDQFGQVARESYAPGAVPAPTLPTPATPDLTPTTAPPAQGAGPMLPATGTYLAPLLELAMLLAFAGGVVRWLGRRGDRRAA